MTGLEHTIRNMINEEKSFNSAEEAKKEFIKILKNLQLMKKDLFNNTLVDYMNNDIADNIEKTLVDLEKHLNSTIRKLR